MKKQNLVIIILLFFAVFANSCSPIRVMSSWKQASAVRQTGKKILVVVHTKRLTNKVIGEEMLAQALKNLGYTADPAANRLRDTSSYKDEKGFNQAVVAMGYDAILSVVCATEPVSNYIPGTIYYAPVGGYGGYYHFYHYYAPRESPGYVETDYRVFYETALYDITKSGGNQLLYTSTSESFDPNTSGIDSRFCKTIIADMFKKGIL